MTSRNLLVLDSHGAGKMNEPRARMLQRFAAVGVGEGRLRFVAYEANGVPHLHAYREVDVALDTFPYHGTVTTCEALWMGVPLISLAGDSHVSRVECSLLRAVGLESLLVSSRADYTAVALELARRPSWRAELRRKLIARMSASELMDGTAYARAFARCPVSDARDP